VPSWLRLLLQLHPSRRLKVTLQSTRSRCLLLRRRGVTRPRVLRSLGASVVATSSSSNRNTQVHPSAADPTTSQPTAKPVRSGDGRAFGIITFSPAADTQPARGASTGGWSECCPPWSARGSPCCPPWAPRLPLLPTMERPRLPLQRQPQRVTMRAPRSPRRPWSPQQRPQPRLHPRTPPCCLLPPPPAPRLQRPLRSPPPCRQWSTSPARCSSRGSPHVEISLADFLPVLAPCGRIADVRLETTPKGVCRGLRVGAVRPAGERPRSPQPSTASLVRGAHAHGRAQALRAQGAAAHRRAGAAGGPSSAAAAAALGAAALLPHPRQRPPPVCPARPSGAPATEGPPDTAEVAACSSCPAEASVSAQLCPPVRAWRPRWRPVAVAACPPLASACEVDALHGAWGRGQTVGVLGPFGVKSAFSKRSGCSSNRLRSRCALLY